MLANSVNKLERRINELTDQMEEEHRIANEQKDLVRLRSFHVVSVNKSVRSRASKLTRRSAIGPPDDPEDPLPEAPGERGGGGGEQEGGAVPQRPERAGRGEGDEQPAAEAAARPAPADKVRALTHT